MCIYSSTLRGMLYEDVYSNEREMRKFGQSESQYVSKDDLEMPDGSYTTVPVTIDRMTVEVVEKDGKKDEKYTVYFVGKEKGLLLNVTNETVLINSFGAPPSSDPVALTQHYGGKNLTLYVDPTVRNPSGGKPGGLRLAVPGAFPTPTTAPEPEPGTDQPSEDWGAPGDEVPF
jgi:hypothetical protein